jgi:uncharacterized protein (TIGR03118 family)
MRVGNTGIPALLRTALLMGGAITMFGATADYYQTNLTSDLPNTAAHQDPNLVNPWGIASSATSPFWTADNGSGLSTLYNGTGTPLSLVVTIAPAPGQSGAADPTGVVFNSGAGSGSFNGSPFIFGTESGTIVSWKGGTGSTIAAMGAAGSVYKGLGIDNTGSTIFAANFTKGRIDVFDSSFHALSLPGAFVDPNLPAGYSPFNVQNIGGSLYVTYARFAGTKDEVDGSGLGVVDVYNTSGVFQKRLAAGGVLDAPWGLALAPTTGFGALSGDLLVGNFGDGMVNAFNPVTGAYSGTVDDSAGNPLAIDGLWGLSFGNGAPGQGRDTLFFNAGIAGPGNVEDHGLFGALNPVPEPGEAGFVACGVLALLAFNKARKRLNPSTKVPSASAKA